ncbi:hypothetical protein CcaverHIS002_0301270 [Cutaneotrichosporon cavernicola]|nr:hypothetical protein CcaverHIS002_0301270 [Cutaneotrichosporon cavernicola]
MRTTNIMRSKSIRYPPEWATMATYLSTHPPPIGEPFQPFLTPELEMHRTFSRRSEQSPAAMAAQDWAIKTYILFKRVKAARDDLFFATYEVRLHPSPQTMTLLEAQRNVVRILVTELRANLKAGRQYHVDFKEDEKVLAQVGSLFYHAVSIWRAMERFLEAFDDDGMPRFVNHDQRSSVGSPRPPKNRRRSQAVSALETVQEDADSSDSDDSIF